MGLVLTCWHTFFKSIYEKRTRTLLLLQGISFGNTVHTSDLFKRIKAFFYIIQSKRCSWFSDPFLVIATPRENGCLHQHFGRCLCDSVGTSHVLVAVSLQQTRMSGEQLCCCENTWNKVHTVTLILFLFPTRRNCYIARMFKNRNNLYTVVKNSVTTSVQI